MVFLWLARMISDEDGYENVFTSVIIRIPEEIDHQRIVTFLQKVDHRVVDLILVLCKPVGDVVVDNAGVVSESKVGVLVLGPGLLLQEGSRFSQQVLLQLVFKGLVVVVLRLEPAKFPCPNSLPDDISTQNATSE